MAVNKLYSQSSRKAIQENIDFLVFSMYLDEDQPPEYLHMASRRLWHPAGILCQITLIFALSRFIKR